MDILNSSTPEKNLLFQFTQGVDVDIRLYKQEIRVQKAWSEALFEAGHITAEENLKIKNCLDMAEKSIFENTFDWRIVDEDIHMNLERFMTESIGILGKKIHLGRSRNDLIATTLRLFIYDQITTVESQITRLKLAIQNKSASWIDVLIPGMTHLQFGQPLRLAHTFAAHGFALKRDLSRLQFNKTECIEYCPLGAAAFAGTHIDINLEKLAHDLKFKTPLYNSYDAVGDRDFILNTLNSFSLIATHLSRFCEDVMYWSSTGIDVIKLSKDWSTGSSIMPNKRNPDIPELVRAKMSRVLSASTSAMVLMRSVVPSYGSDLHELKRTFLLALDELQSCLDILVPFTDGLEADSGRAREHLESGHILATDIANSIAKTSTFREAYKLLSEKVKEANAQKLQVHDLFKNSPHAITFEQSVENRNQRGGTSRKQCIDSINGL